MTYGSFSTLAPSSSSGLFLVVSSCVLSTAATALFVAALHRAGPVRAVVLRSLEVVAVIAVQIAAAVAGREFALADLAAAVLVLVAASHVAMEMLFY